MSQTETGAEGTPPPGYDEIRAEFAAAELGRHLAMFYDDPSIQLRTASAFVDAALQQNRRCLYLADVNDIASVEAALEAAGIDVAERVDAGDLDVREASEVYLKGGFDGERAIRVLGAAARAAVDDGYDGLAVAGENTWCFCTDMAFEEIVAFETDFDAEARDLPVSTLCQYDVDRFDEEALTEAIRTHEQVVYRGTVCENPYYVSPEHRANGTDPETNVRLILEQTRDLARSRRDIERHGLRLAVVNRTLRHNIRNDLNAVLGYLSLLRETASLDETASNHLDVAERVANRVVETAEKARYVQQTLGDATVTTAGLRAVVDSAVGEMRSRYPEARIEVADVADLTVLADEHLDVALEEVLTNSIVHQTADPPSVTIEASRESGDRVALTISNPGPDIPKADRKVFDRGEETHLTHGSGLGLWLVKWIVENARGRVQFPEEDREQSGDDGRTHLRIELVVVGD